MSWNGFAGGVIFEHRFSEVAVGQGEAKHLLAGEGEQESGGHGPRNGGPARNPYANGGEDEE